jgi:hypothetical protein
MNFLKIDVLLIALQINVKFLKILIQIYFILPPPLYSIFKCENLNKFFESEFYGNMDENFSNTSCDSMSKPINSLYIDSRVNKKCFTFFNDKLEVIH